MELITLNVKHLSYFCPINLSTSNNNNNVQLYNVSYNYPFQFHNSRKTKLSSFKLLTHARRKKNNYEPLSEVKPRTIEDVSEVDDENYELGIEKDDILVAGDDDLIDDEFLDEEGYFEDEYENENAEVYAGDGAEGGGISLAGTWWDKEALTIAENVTESFDGDLGMYAFRTLVNATVQVRIEKLSTKSGSPTMSDIEAFSTAYRARLDEAELAKTIPENISIEVSSPGVERVIRVPRDFERFKERSMYVKYITEVPDTGTSTENDGVFRLVSFDLETNSCTWGLADVRINREKAGKGRPMNKKQREWRLTTPFDSIRLVRIYSEC